MDHKHHPDASPLHELSEPLRQAVEQVRADAVPAEAMQRALDKAERIAATIPLPRRSPRLRYAIAGVVAATLLGAVGIWLNVAGRQNAALPVVVINVSPGQAADNTFEAHGRAADDTLKAPDNSDLGLDPAATGMPANDKPEAEDRLEIILRRRDAKTANTSNEASVSSPVAGAPAPTGGPATAPLPPGARRSAPAGLGGVPGGPGGGGSLPGWHQTIPTFGGYAGMPKEKAPAPDDNTLRFLERGGTLRSPGLSQPEGLREREATSSRGLGTSKTPSSVSQDGSEANKDRLDDSHKEKEVVEGGTDKDKKAGLAKKSSEAKKGEAEKLQKRVWRRNGGPPAFARVYIGDGNALELVSLHVSVTVEGPRARTVVDHIFRNPHARQLEGTFEYPLPSGASPSYFAMFLGQTREAAPALFARRAGAAAALPQTALASLAPEQLVRNVDTTDWGRLQEARIVAKDKALETYEEVVRGRIDPALLEYAGGNTFRGRVFPIPPSGYNRVVLAYEELLPVSGGKMMYRFPLPDCNLRTMNFSLQATAADCREREILPKGAAVQEAAGRVYYTHAWENEAPDGEVLFRCTPATPEVQAVTGRRGENGPTYAYARVRPELKKLAAEGKGASHAVFLLDTSLSEHADRFGVSMKLLRKVLESDPAIQKFNVVTFNVGAAWVAPKAWLPNTKEGRDQLFAALDGIVLEGATDVGAALDRLTQPPPGLSEGAAVDCFLLSDGHITWGETDVSTMVTRFESRCQFVPRFHGYRTGLGAENGELYEALTRRGGGVFNCFTEADLTAAAVAHRNQCLRVENVRFVGGSASSDVLVAGRRAAVYPGGELVVAGRFQGAGKTTLLVEGTFAGQKFAQEYPIEVKDGGELAPRGWAEIAVASLLALNDPKLDPLVTAYCQQFNVGSRTASFLVLENEADYKRFNLEEERGKTVGGDLGKFIEQLWGTLAQAISPRQAFERFFDKLEARASFLPGDGRGRVRKLLSLMNDKDFELPTAALKGEIVRTKEVPPEYLAARDRDRRNATTYLAEARRRSGAGDVDGAVRVLSSVIEEHPGRGDALRLVGYRLLDLKQAGQAARLFEAVQRQRPFEPHSYRDLARSLEETGNLALAAVQYEIVLGSIWHNRFGESLKLVAQEEYARLMQDAIRGKGVNAAVANYFGERLERLPNPQPKADLRVTISWNTDATDVDLWVIEPDGTKCFYQHNRTKNGGELSQDLTQGYGPERYQAIKALKGKYRVLVHYFSDNPNLLAGETHVNVVVTRFAGSPQEVVERHTVILKKKGEEVEVSGVEF